FDEERKVVHDRLRPVCAAMANGACRTADEGVQSAPPVLRAVGLVMDEGVLAGLTKNRRSELTAGIAVDAGRVDEEVAGDILRDTLVEVRHDVAAPFPQG